MKVEEINREFAEKYRNTIVGDAFKTDIERLADAYLAALDVIDVVKKYHQMTDHTSICERELWISKDPKCICGWDQIENALEKLK